MQFMPSASIWKSGKQLQILEEEVNVVYKVYAAMIIFYKLMKSSFLINFMIFSDMFLHEKSRKWMNNSVSSHLGVEIMWNSVYEIQENDFPVIRLPFQ